MKTTCLLFLTMTWAAWTQGTGYALPSQETSPASSANPASGHPSDAGRGAPAGDGRHPAEGSASDQHRDNGGVSGPNHRPSRTSFTKVNRPMPIPKSRQPPMPGNALHPPGSNISTGGAKGGLILNQTVNSASPIRTTSVVRPTGPILNSVRHRGPNPAVVGGSLNLRSSNAGTINGTHMNRKP